MIGLVNFNQKAVDEFFKISSPSLIMQVNDKLLESVTKQNPLSLRRNMIFFGNSRRMHKEIVELSKIILLQDHAKETILFEQGDECDGIYIVQEGSLIVYVKG